MAGDRQPRRATGTVNAAEEPVEEKKEEEPSKEFFVYSRESINYISFMLSLQFRKHFLPFILFVTVEVTIVSEEER